MSFHHPSSRAGYPGIRLSPSGVLRGLLRHAEREGAKLTRTRITKTFHGDVEGESTAELLMAYAAEEGSAAYVCFLEAGHL